MSGNRQNRAKVPLTPFGRGILTEDEADALHAQGIRSTHALLNALAESEAAKRVAAETGIALGRLNELQRLAELRAVQGVGDGSALLLMEAGVLPVRDLRRRNPARLHRALAKTNARLSVLGRHPGRNVVALWVSRAARFVDAAEKGVE